MGLWRMQDLGMPAVEELLLDCLVQFLTEDEKDRLVGLHLGVSLQVNHHWQ